LAAHAIAANITKRKELSDRIRRGKANEKKFES
jgi:hypothetical protein